MDIGKWQLRLVHEGASLKEGFLHDLMKPGTCLELLALVVEEPEMLERCKLLHKCFNNRQFVYCYGSLRQVSQVVKTEKEAILNGDVAFHFEGDNLLELLLKNWKVQDIEEPMSWLLSGGASVNQCSSDGCTPLLSACARGLGKAGLILLQHGAKAHETGPNGEDSLTSALKFFARTPVKPRSCEEDMDLGRLCCLLRASDIDRGNRTLNVLERARLALSQAAIELGLCASVGTTLNKQMILDRAFDVEKSSLEAGAGEDLWAGWPGAFFSFSQPLSQDSAWDDSFSLARARILSHWTDSGQMEVDNDGAVYMG